MPALRPLLVAVTVLAVTGAGLAVADAAPPKRPDLTVTKTQTLAFTGAGGRPVRTRTTVKNIGTKRAGASTTGLYLSRNAKLDGGDTRLARIATPALDPGGTERQILAGVLPANLPTGTWRLLVCADIHDKVLEGTGSNNCATWKTFTIEDDPDLPVEQGPIGGATASCGGKYRPFETGPGTVPAGVHLSVVEAVDEVVVTHEADAVGYESIEGDDGDYRHTTVTLRNDGTAAASGLVVDAVSCEYDTAKPGYWAILERDTAAETPGQGCGSTLQPGATCEMSFFARSIRRGGNGLSGAMRVFGYVAGDPATAMWATFPIVSSATSRGYLELNPLFSNGASTVTPGTTSYQIVEATNVGDLPAVPTFAITEAVGTPAGIFNQNGPAWTPLDGGSKCTTSHDPGPPPVTFGALGVGDSCQFQVAVCSILANQTYEATLLAKDAYVSSAETYSYPFDLRYVTSTGGDGSCDDPRPSGRAAPAGPTSVGPASALAGERVTVRTSLPTKVRRPVVVQRKQGSRWVTLSKGDSNRQGKVAVRIKASDVTVRVVAPRHGGRPAYTSQPERFRPAYPAGRVLGSLPDGSLPPGGSSSASISADGRYVALLSPDALNGTDLNGFNDVYLYDRTTGSYTLVSHGLAGEADDESSQPVVSADGSAVAFGSGASNLVTGDTNGVDVFVWKRSTGDITLVSRDELGGPINDNASSPSISDNGRFVAYQTSASDLVAADTNGAPDVFWFDTVSQVQRLVSHRTSGDFDTAGGSSPAISGDGDTVAFVSAADTITARAANGTDDVFAWNGADGSMRLVSDDRNGKASNGRSTEPSVSRDGRYVAFTSQASDLVQGVDPGGFGQVFVDDRTTGRARLVSPSRAAFDGASYHATISGDGAVIAYKSSDSHQVAGDTNGRDDVFVRLLTSGTTHRVSVGTRGKQATGGDAYSPSISRIAAFVVYASTADNLAPGDASSTSDTFLTTLRVPWAPPGSA